MVTEVQFRLGLYAILILFGTLREGLLEKNHACLSFQMFKFHIFQVPKLLHLSRLAVRKCFRTSKLLHGRFLDDLPIPKSLRDYMTFQSIPEELLPS